MMMDVAREDSAVADLELEKDLSTVTAPPSNATKTNDRINPSTTASSRVQYRKDYLNPGGEVVFSRLESGHNLHEEPTHPIIVITQLRTKHAKDAYRLPSEKDLPPPVISSESRLIEIRSRAVIHALRTVVGYYPDARFTGNVVSIAEPFPLLYHYRQELQAYANDFEDRADQGSGCTEDQNVAADIRILLGIFEDMYGQSVRDELLRYELDKPTCTHDMLWMLYKPGADVYFDLQENKVFNAFVFRSLSFTYADRRASTYDLEQWHMSENNMYVGASVALDSDVVPFAGEKEIADLRVFPCKYLNKEKHGVSHEERYKQLVKRGEVYFNLLKGPQFASFDGSDIYWPATAYRGRVMVDMHQYCLRNDLSEGTAVDVEMSNVIVPRCTCPRCLITTKKWSQARIQFAGYSEINPLKKDALTEHQRFLSNHGLYTYVLKTRSWKKLQVEGFTWPPPFRTNLIDTLVMRSNTRDHLQSLCRKYTSKSTWSADFIEGKGEGSIVLLHGPPGVGKTYTAGLSPPSPTERIIVMLIGPECVAEEVQRPLISLTSADIGTEPGPVENQLLYWFELAKAWGAILLLDEADVFLERRSTRDLVRNNLVSIFLRTLEYYQGILFLTTNRVGTFDEAFLSRIDVSVGFKALDQESRISLWSNFIRKLERDRPGKIRVEVDVKYYIKKDEDLLSLKWNGREIRSGFQTAVALAEIEALGSGDADAIVVVTKEHIEKVVEMSKEFKNYIREVHQKGPGDLAASLGHRADSPSPTGAGAAKPW